MGAFRFHWEFDGLANQQKASGTNVRFTPRLVVDYDATSNARDQFVSYEIKSYRTRIGADVVCEQANVGQTYPKPAPGAQNPVAKFDGRKVVFASTHFPDGAAIALAMYAQISLKDFNGIVQTHDCYGYLNPVAYNRGMNVSTVVLEDETRPDPSSPNYDMTPPGQALPIAKLSREKLGPATAAHHSFWPSTPEASQAIDLPALKALLTTSTLSVQLVHGSPFGTCTSLAGSTGILHFDSISSEPKVRSYAVYGRPSGIPLMNMVITYSCSTLEYAIAHTAYCYGLMDADDVILPDRAYTGFDKDVYNVLLLDPTNGENGRDIPVSTPMTARTSDHARVLLESLRVGMTIEQAVDTANARAMPRTRVGSVWRRLPMLVSGDREARLVNAYLSKAERAQHNETNTVNTWYFIFP